MESNSSQNSKKPSKKANENESPFTPRILVDRICTSCITAESDGTQMSLPLRVACYNVLAQCHLENNKYLYVNSPGHVLKWEFRRDNLIREIASIDADILCLQEVQEEHYKDFFEPQLSALGYSTFYQRKTRKNKDGVSISFKKEHFQLFKDVPVLYYRSQDEPLLNSDNVGLILLLEWKLPRQYDDMKDKFPKNWSRICIATTHLIYNTKRGDLKLTQMSLLLDEIGRLTRCDNPSCPVILCGDFNSEPASRMMHFVLRGKLPLDDTAVSVVSGQSHKRTCHTLKNVAFPSILSHRLKKNGSKEMCLRHPFPSFHSVYSYLDAGTNDDLKTSYTSNGSAVDYILYTRPCSEVAESWDISSLCLKSYWKLLTDKQLHMKGGLPNYVNSSDHLPLIGNFSFNVFLSKSSAD